VLVRTYSLATVLVAWSLIFPAFWGILVDIVGWYSGLMTLCIASEGVTGTVIMIENTAFVTSDPVCLTVLTLSEAANGHSILQFYFPPSLDSLLAVRMTTTPSSS